MKKVLDYVGDTDAPRADRRRCKGIGLYALYGGVIALPARRTSGFRLRNMHVGELAAGRRRWCCSVALRAGGRARCRALVVAGDAGRGVRRRWSRSRSVLLPRTRRRRRCGPDEPHWRTSRRRAPTGWCRRACTSPAQISATVPSYILSISPAKLVSTPRRLIFMRRRHLAVLDRQVAGQDRELLDRLPAVELGVQLLDVAGHHRLAPRARRRSPRTTCPPAACRPPSPTIASGSSVTSIVQKLRAWPMTTACDVYGQIALNMPSMCDGAMYLPPDVLTRSFLRSVMRQEAVGVELADVAGAEEAVLGERGRGLLRQVVVAAHDRHAAQQDLAVVVDLALEVAHRLADRADLARSSGAVDEVAGAGLGQAVALARSAARPRRRTRRSSWLSGAAPETSTRIRPPRRAWSLLKTSLLATPYCSSSARRHRLAGLLQRDLLACRRATAQREDLRLGAARALRRGDHPVVDLLEDARRARTSASGWTTREVVDELVDPAVHVGRQADVDDAADQRLAERVRQRQPQVLQVVRLAAGPSSACATPSQHQPACSSSTPLGRPVVPEV